MLNTANSIIALLKSSNIKTKEIAISKLDLIVDQHWAEISDHIKLLENIYEESNNQIKEQIALILSKLYFHLEDYENSIEWALESKSKFNYKNKSSYSLTLLRKILEKYVSIKKHNFFNSSNILVIDSKIESLVDQIFNDCLNNKEYKHAIGFCIESYDIERIFKAIEKSNNILENLKYIISVSQDSLQNKIYKSAILNLALSLLLKHNPKEYEEIIKCQFTLKDINAVASTLISILNEKEEPLIAYQIALNLYDNQNSYFLSEISSKINSLSGINSSSNDDDIDLYSDTNTTNQNINLDKTFLNRINKLKSILEGNIHKNIEGKVLSKLNKSDDKLFDTLKKGVEKCGSGPALGVIISHSLMNARTKNDEILKKNIDWISKMTNWSRFAASAALGVIHMGNTEKGYETIKPYLPGSNQNPSVYAQAGAYYGLGLIYANTNNSEIVKVLNEALSSNSSSNIQDCLQHGILLAIGLVKMGAGNEDLYIKLRDFMYKDDAIIGEAATYAIGLTMLSSKNEEVIEDLLAYAHDTQHEKIIRAISLSLALIMYGSEEGSDNLVDQMSKDKDPIIRYGAMFVLGLAYAGTGNSAAFKKLIKFSVSDNNDDVRRGALISIGFLHFRNPGLLIKKLKVLHLLSESYNQHVRYGTAMSLGIACAGTCNIDAYNIIEPLLNDPFPLVRQGAYIASGMIMSQCNSKIEPKFGSFKENLEKINNNKDEHNLIKLGTLICQGLLDVGGRNCSLNLVSNNGQNRVGAIVGMALFTQYFYWFPMAHFISLAISPQVHIGIDSEFKVVTNFNILCKEKPSIYGYPEELKVEEKTEKDKIPAAVLSSTTRILAKKKSKLGTSTSYNTNMQIELEKAMSSKKGTTNEYKPIPVDEIKKKEDTNKDLNKMQIDDIVDDKENKKKEEINQTEKEPNEIMLQNPSRILLKQRSVVSFPENQIFEQAMPILYNGLIVLKKVKPEIKTEYFELEEEKVEKDNDKDANIDKDKKEEKDKDGYKAVPNNDDADMPDEFDIKVTNTK